MMSTSTKPCTRGSAISYECRWAIAALEVAVLLAEELVEVGSALLEALLDFDVTYGHRAVSKLR
jgi:hypothetical protein